jgi:hypothetical protein
VQVCALSRLKLELTGRRRVPACLPAVRMEREALRALVSHEGGAASLSVSTVGSCARLFAGFPRVCLAESPIRMCMRAPCPPCGWSVKPMAATAINMRTAGGKWSFVGLSECRGPTLYLVCAYRTTSIIKPYELYPNP